MCLTLTFEPTPITLKRLSQPYNFATVELTPMTMTFNASGPLLVSSWG